MSNKPKSNFHKTHRLVGGYLPLPVIELVNLYCTYAGISKSTYISRLIQNDLAESLSIEEMANSIANDLLLHKDHKTTKDRYLTQMKYWLIRKKLTDSQIELVLSYIQEGLNGKKEKSNA